MKSRHDLLGKCRREYSKLLMSGQDQSSFDKGNCSSCIRYFLIQYSIALDKVFLLAHLPIDN